jgi:RNA polymerase sigma factor (sigma-70 family)
MNRVLTLLRHGLADAPADRHLLDRFLAARDEAAFAELVRRYGPVVWGACRRCLASAQDAEDAFQATFFVLLRRADRLSADVPLGPWLHKVAVMTARNVVRGNRRRAAVGGPLEHEPTAPAGGSAETKLDLDSILLALPERERQAVVLCHLQGLTRREAAERLGCPEGTLSARLSRALRRLQARFGAAALAAGAVAVPPQLASATARSATIFMTSTLSAAGVSPAVVGLTNGVLRMLWMKKLTAAVAAALVLGAGVLALGFAGSTAVAARAGEGDAPPAPKAADAPDPLRRVEALLADLEKQKRQLDQTLERLQAEKQQLEDAKKAREAVAAAAELGKDVEVAVGKSDGPRPYLVREVVNGRVAEMTCSSLDLLTLYLTRARTDPKGPKALRVTTSRDVLFADLKKVLTACEAAGYKHATLSYTAAEAEKMKSFTFNGAKYDMSLVETRKPKLPPGAVDLTEFAGPKKP